MKCLYLFHSAGCATPGHGQGDVSGRFQGLTGLFFDRSPGCLNGWGSLTMRWERISYDRLIGRFRERQEGRNLIRGRHANFLMEREKRSRVIWATPAPVPIAAIPTIYASLRCAVSHVPNSLTRLGRSLVSPGYARKRGAGGGLSEHGYTVLRVGRDTGCVRTR